MKLSIDLPADNFLAGESIPATVSIRNDGDRPIEVPDPAANVNDQPVYVVRGPTYPGGHIFSLRSVAHGIPVQDPAGPEPMTLTLAPGDTHPADIELTRLADLGTVGRYEVAASLTWKGEKARSEVRTIEVRPAALHGYQLAAAAGLNPAFPIRVLAMAGTEAEPLAYLLIFQEDGNTGQVDAQSVTRFAALGAGATRLFVPWMNYAGAGQPSVRVGWQAGSRLGVIGYGESVPAALDPGFPATPLGHALMSASGDLDLFVAGADGKSIALLRFPPGGQRPALPTPPPGTVSRLKLPAAAAHRDPAMLWTQPLGGRLLAAGTALAPAGLGDRRVAVALEESAGGLAAVLVEAENGAASARVRRLALPRLSAMADAQVAVRVADDGSVQAACLAMAKPERDAPPHAVVLDLAWPAAAGQDGRVAASTPVYSAGKPLGSAVGYQVMAGGQMRRDWVVLLEGGELVASRAPGERIRTHGRPVQPLVLLVAAQRSHVLTVDGNGVAAFEPF